MSRSKMRRLFFGAISLLLLAGCERHIDSRDPDLTQEKVPVPINLSAQLEDRSVTLSWETPDTAGIGKFRIYVGDSSQTNFRIIDSTTGLAFTKNVFDFGQTGLQFFKVSAVSTSGFEGDRSAPLAARIAFMSIIVNNEDEFTNSRDVSVTADAPLVITHIMLSEDSELVGAVFKPFSGAAPFKVSDSDGVKRIYGRLQFEDGNQSGILKTNAITLDTKAVIDSVIFKTAISPASPGTAIHFFIYARESGGQAVISVPGLDDILLVDNGSHPDGDTTANDGIYSAKWIVPINTTVSSAIVTGSFQDHAGNTAVSKIAAQPLNIFSPPLPVNAAAFALSTFQIQLTWTASASTGFTAYRIYRALAPNVTTSSVLLASIEDQNQSSFIDSTLNENTQAYYKIFVYDNTGLSSGSNEVTAKTMVNTAPQQIDFFAVKNADTSISLTWTASPDADFGSYRIYKSNVSTVTTSDELVAIFNDIGTTEYTTEFDNPPQTLYFRIFVFDRHGLSTGSVTRSVSP